jgi:hypothetical protein
MTIIPKTYSIPLLYTLLLAVGATAGEPAVVKKKTYSKTYTVSTNEKVSFNNKFGELRINTWDKNEVKVDVTITAEAKTDETAQRILDHVSIEDGKKDGGVYFRTKLAKNGPKWEKGDKQGFHIDYVAYVPARNPLNVQNEFGPIVLGDHQGDAWLTSKFGTLTTGKLGNVKKLLVEFGKANIGSINNGRVDIKFSKAAIEHLNGDVDVNLEYCDVAKLKVDNATKALDIKNKFSHLYLDVNTNFSAYFDISTSFGKLSNKTNFPIKEEGRDEHRRGPQFNKRYSGKSGDGNTTMKIRSEYGEVTLGHNLNINIDGNRNNNSNDRSRQEERSERKPRRTTAI